MKASSSCNAAGSRNRAIFASCIPGILRRILGFNSPFDNNCLNEDDNEQSSDRSNPVGSSGTATPGVVAKLMGLESLPLERRRRGMIIPITYHEAEDENFYIFNFESHFKKKKKSGKKMIRKKDGLVKENDTNNVDNKEELLGNLQVEEDGRRSNVLCPLKNNNICQKNGRLKRAKVNCDTEVDSENSSPNSVLEFVEFSGDHHQQASSCSGDDVTRMGNSRMRRTLCEELEKCEGSKEKKRLLIGFGENNVYVGKWDEIGIEVTKLSWVQDKMFRNRNHVKEIGIDVASLILGQLLDELIGNLNHF